MGWKELDDAEIKSHLKYTRDWDPAKRFVKTKKQLPEGLLAFATAPLHKAPYQPDVNITFGFIDGFIRKPGIQNL